MHDTSADSPHNIHTYEFPNTTTTTNNNTTTTIITNLLIYTIINCPLGQTKKKKKYGSPTAKT
jgi:hypothetical protein